MSTNARELAELATAYAGGNGLSFRNRIINGDMRIDQRNNGAAVTANQDFPVDRWQKIGTASSSLQRSTDAPAGFTNSLLTTITATGDSSSTLRIQQHIEGFNVSDLAWGTADARAVTISFWVKSSVAGTYSARITNDAGNRVYMATFAVGSSNAWEYKAVTVPGDTTGTWLTNNGRGITVSYVLAGATAATPNVWGTTGTSATGQTNLCLTNGATFFITGVQLEAGSVATPFERRPYGTELALCQRYLPAYNAESSSNTSYGTSAQGSNTTRMHTSFQFPVQTRTAPTGVSISSASHFIGGGQNTNMSFSSVSFQYANRLGAKIFFDGSGGTAQQAIDLISQNAAGQILFTGCEL
jgi:hypothetical protein